MFRIQVVTSNHIGQINDKCHVTWAKHTFRKALHIANTKIALQCGFCAVTCRCGRLTLLSGRVRGTAHSYCVHTYVLTFLLTYWQHTALDIQIVASIIPFYIREKQQHNLRSSDTGYILVEANKTQIWKKGWNTIAVNVPGLSTMVVFYAFVLGTGIWASIKSKKLQSCSRGQLENRFLANRRVGLLVRVFTTTGQCFWWICHPQG